MVQRITGEPVTDPIGFAFMLTLMVYPVLVILLSITQTFTVAESSIIAIPFAIISALLVLPAVVLIATSLVILALYALGSFIYRVTVLV